jgi:excinuclease ABC A subunit
MTNRPSDLYGRIEIRGAREHTLRNVDVDIPKRELTVVTGVSGSGKSSLIFDTLAAESQRQLNDTFTAFQQARLPSYGQPDVDSLTNLSAVIVVDQKRMTGSGRSTVATATDIGARTRLVFSRLGTPSLGPSHMFGFNDPQGMCPTCSGLGITSLIDEDELVDRDLSLNDGALTWPMFKTGQWFWKTYAFSGFFDPAKKVRDYTDDEFRTLMYPEAGSVECPGVAGHELVPGSYEGVVARFTRLYLHKDADTYKGKAREAFERIVTKGTCPACAGTRLNDAVRSCRIDGRSIADWNALQVDELIEIVRAIDDPATKPLVEDLIGQLDGLIQLGLGYLSLDRSSSTLSGGESQRVRMVRHLGSALADMLYVFDEPTVGLHAGDIERLGTLLQALRDKGNTVVVVEHEPAVMAIADHCIDMGPAAGRHGGQVTFTGSYEQLRESPTRTGEALRRTRSRTTRGRTPTGAVRIEHADTHNLQDVTVDIPTGVLTAVTGVAGSGKSSLIHGHLPAAGDDVLIVDQSPIRGSRRSSPATFTGLLDPVRKLFAAQTGAPAGLFTPNSDGGCPSCQGVGLIYTDLAFLEGVTTVCETCQGRRFTPEAQSHRVRGRSIADVFEMSVEDARAFFPEKRIAPVLQRLDDVGLGYLALGQSLNTLSGGERQRLKLASELGDAGKMIVLDEPTTGLHPADVEALIALMNRMVDAGNSVVVIEHDLDVIAAADRVIDMGPGAGHQGGRVVFEGTPQELARAATPTGRFLAGYWADYLR